MWGQVTADPATPCTGGYMQVVAHEDDDLIFMNPDVDRTIGSGTTTVTVYVTAGEYGASDPALRARTRQRGVQNAYAAMAGVADGDDATQLEWDRVAVPVASRYVERYSLRARPCVALAFMNLPDSGLAHLNGSPTHFVNTVVPTGGVAPGSYVYTRADVLAVLGGLLGQHLPTVLRYQDDAPDWRYAHDHDDHVAAAGFARDAAAAYGGPLYTLPYRGYGVENLRANLDPSTVDRKTSIMRMYAALDTWVLVNPNDPGSALGAAYQTWLARSYYRWPRGTQWAARNADGTAQAFVVRNGQIFNYRQTLAGGWAPPRELTGAGGPVAPGVAAITGKDGRLALFVRLLSTHQIRMWRQTVASGDSGTWTDLGNPNTGLGHDASVGSPAAVINEDGRLEVFVKNGGGGVSTRFEVPGGSWYPGWHDLQGGPHVQDGLCAVLNPGGNIELFASTLGEIKHWYQLNPNGAIVSNPSFPGTVPASPPGCALTEAGTIDVVYRREATGQMTVSWQDVPDGGWGPGPVDIAGVVGGVGEPAMVTTAPGSDPDNRIMLFARDAAGTVSFTRQTAANMGYGSWLSMGDELIVDYPAATVGVGDRVVVFAVRAGGVYAAVQQAAGGTANFGPWGLAAG